MAKPSFRCSNCYCSIWYNINIWTPLQMRTKMLCKSPSLAMRLHGYNSDMYSEKCQLNSLTPFILKFLTTHNDAVDKGSPCWSNFLLILKHRLLIMTRGPQRILKLTNKGYESDCQNSGQKKIGNCSYMGIWKKKSWASKS